MHSTEKRRKRVVLTLEDKLGVIQDRDNGLSVDSIADKYNIGSSTVSEICKRRVEIEHAVEKNKINGLTKSRKTLRESSKPMVETELYNWYLDQKDQDIRPTQNEFIEKAREINSQLNHEENDEDEEEWNPTKGWLLRFKERYGIKPGTKYQQQPELKTWQSALEAADFLLGYINTRDFLLKDIITVRMIRDKLANEPEAQPADY